MGQLKDKITSQSPPWLLNTYLKIKYGLRKDVYKNVEVVNNSSLGAIYHLCTQKTGSQWIKSIFADPRVYRYTGLKPYFLNSDFQKALKKLENKSNGKSSSSQEVPKLPSKKILTPLYIYRSNFEALPKPERYKGFFVARDPRDLLISQYYSQKSTHKKANSIDSLRKELENKSLQEGIIMTLKVLDERGYWERLHSWTYNQNEHIKLCKYEDLIGDHKLEAFRALFEHLEIPMPESELKELIEEYSFEKLTGGRKQGQEVDSSHLRKGVSGDWKNYFTEKIEQEFNEVTGQLVYDLGYN
jgi:hypothetical protein